jgi:hypothetical protein
VIPVTHRGDAIVKLKDDTPDYPDAAFDTDGVTETEIICATGLGLLFTAVLVAAYADRIAWLYQTLTRRARR